MSFDPNVALSNLCGMEVGGASRIKTMLGARNLTADKNWVSFRWPMKAKNKANFCKITLEGDDTYTVEFGYIRAGKYTQRSKTPGLYCDMLRGHFEDSTALYLSF